MKVHKKIILLISILILGVTIWLLKDRFIPYSYSSYTLEYSDGSCSPSRDTCKAVNFGCGATQCTNNPSIYNNMGSICYPYPDHPAKKGFLCKCISKILKCGWVK